MSELTGHGIPSPAAARKFLKQFHEEEKIEAAKGRRTGDRIAYIHGENEPLERLRLVNRALIQELGRRRPERRIATVDRDAAIIERGKRAAVRT